MKRIIAGLLLSIGLASPALAQVITMPPPAGVTIMGCVYQASPPVLTTGQIGYVQCSNTGSIGGGGGGGGGAVTIASGAVASGAYSAGAFAVGSGVDGWDIGVGPTTAASPAVGAVGSVNAKLRLMTSQLDAITTGIGSPIPAGAAHIGQVGIDAYAASTWSPGTGNNGLFAAVLTLETTEMNALANAAVAPSTVGGTSGTFTNSNTAQARVGEIYFTSGATATCTAGGNLTGWFLQSYDGTTFESTASAPPRAPDFVIPFPTAAIGTGTYKGQSQISIPALNFKVLVQNNCGVTLGATGNVVRLAPLAGLN